MESFRVSYNKFSKDMVTFVDLLTQRFKQGTPDALQHLKLIPDTLTTTDPDLRKGNVKMIVYKFGIVLGTAMTVFKFLLPCVQDQFREWVQNEVMNLIWWLRRAEMSSATMIVDTDNRRDSVSLVASGTGGTNIFEAGGMDPESLEKLNKLCTEIEKYANQRG